MTSLEATYEELRRYTPSLPLLVVLAVALVLLHGVTGTCDSMWWLLADLLAALLGGGSREAVIPAVCRIVPLAVVAAGLTFAISSRWFQLDNLLSYAWAALILIAGSTLGNACYQTIGQPHMEQVTQRAPDESAADHAQRLRDLLEQHGDSPEELRQAVAQFDPNAPLTQTATDAFQRRLSEIRWFKRPDLIHAARPIAPLFPVPEGDRTLRAISQMLGYVVDFEPRLFLAATLLGGFLGWRAQRQVALARAHVTGDLSELNEHEAQRLAA